MKKYFLLALAVLALSCAKTDEPRMEDQTVLTITLSDKISKTTMGPSEGGGRHVYWSEGDQLCLNGTASQPLTEAEAGSSQANFVFPGVLNTPYRLLYPASFYKNATTITLPATQTWAAGTFATQTAPLYAYAAGASDISIRHLCAIVHLSVKKDSGVSASKLTRVTFSGKDGEPVCGDFTLDYTNGDLTPADSGEELSLTLSQSLSESTALDLFLVVPPGEYKGFSVVLQDEFNRKMTKVKSSAITLEAGKLCNMPEFTFVPSPTATEFSLGEIVEEVLPLDNFNVTGRVVNQSGEGLGDVVVSDGRQSVRTMFDGSFYLQSNLSDTKFISISTPSGYQPPRVNGLPVFFQRLSDLTPSGGVYTCEDFVLEAVPNPERYTVLFTADPQSRNTAGWFAYENSAYHSLEIAKDMYQELKEVALTMSDRAVYGICLGDLVHNTPSLLSTYANYMNKLPFMTYNVIGNHDYDTHAADDDAGAVPFENIFGPRNYSFNIGRQHYVVLDNLIMYVNNGTLSAFQQGLDEKAWAWLQSDLALVDKNTTLMVCAHSPMFKLESGNERSNTAQHGPDYGALIDKFAQVHAWAGHTHTSFNYVYPSTHRHRNVNVHTLARSTGELWTNEYLASGTPRGFTVVDVNGDNITWTFHPNKYQRPAFIGIEWGYTTAEPTYSRRDWTYDANGIAKMKNGGTTLDENYQMHVYPAGAYGDDCVYANVFLWDGSWALPVFTPTGGTPVAMTQVTSDTRHDLAMTEIRTHYKTYCNTFKQDADYTASQVGAITTLFRVAVPSGCKGGTVSVTDRFGRVWTQSVSWQ